MNLNPLAASLLSLSLLTSSLALPVQAAPQYPQDQQQQPHQNGQPSGKHQGQKAQPAPQRQQAQPKAQQHQAQQAPRQQQNQRPPQDFSAVHQAFHEHRGQIGAGPALPPGIHIQPGKPLPKGYGKRLDARALHGLPHYPGYEWRRVGTDIVLVTIATGIVYTVLQGVLR